MRIECDGCHIWELISLLWSTVGETALAKGFYFIMGDTKYPCFHRRTKLPGRGVYSEKVREVGRRWVREEVETHSWQFVIYSGHCNVSWQWNWESVRWWMRWYMINVWKTGLGSRVCCFKPWFASWSPLFPPTLVPKWFAQCRAAMKTKDLAVYCIYMYAWGCLGTIISSVGPGSC